MNFNKYALAAAALAGVAFATEQATSTAEGGNGTNAGTPIIAEGNAEGTVAKNDATNNNATKDVNKGDATTGYKDDATKDKKTIVTAEEQKKIDEAAKVEAEKKEVAKKRAVAILAVIKKASDLDDKAKATEIEALKLTAEEITILKAIEGDFDEEKLTEALIPKPAGPESHLMKYKLLYGLGALIFVGVVGGAYFMTRKSEETDL